MLKGTYHTEDSIRKMREAHGKGKNNPLYGIPRPEFSERWRKRISKSKKGKTAWNKGLTIKNGNKGIHRRGGMKGHNYDHGKGDVCKKCGKIHIHTFLNKKVTKEEQEKKTQALISFYKTEKGLLSRKKALATRKRKYGENGFKRHWTENPEVAKKTLRKIVEARSRQITPIKDTSIEVVLQKALLKRNISFMKHKLFRLPNGRYHRIDIFIKPNIIIEADGCYYHACPIHYKGKSYEEITARNTKITNELQQQGYIVLRFWGCEIRENLNECIEKILSKIHLPLIF